MHMLLPTALVQMRASQRAVLVVAAFEEMQKALEACAFSTELSGSTCVVAHLHRRQLSIGWVGDSRAVLGRAKQGSKRCVAVPLTHDHKPGESREHARILAMNGRVERCDTFITLMN
jgi:serine/threonine protein phosphatase PrpC